MVPSDRRYIYTGGENPVKMSHCFTRNSNNTKNYLILIQYWSILFKVEAHLAAQLPESSSMNLHWFGLYKKPVRPQYIFFPHGLHLGKQVGTSDLNNHKDQVTHCMTGVITASETVKWLFSLWCKVMARQRDAVVVKTNVLAHKSSEWNNRVLRHLTNAPWSGSALMTCMTLMR